MEIKNVKRPKFCICEKCLPIVNQGAYDENLNDGGSVFCMGENFQKEIWTASKTEHINDICFCIYTPFKGWTRYVMNDDDFSIISCMIRSFSKKTKRPITLAGVNEVSKINFE